jgi:hypothetical protein
MRAREITAALKGRWHGSYGVVPCVVHDDKKPSLRLRDGDTGRLLVHCYAGCSAPAVLNEMKRRGFIGGKETEAPDMADAIREREAADKKRLARKRESIRRILGGCAPLQHTPAELYLRRRGITIELPPVLRYHHALRHPDLSAWTPGMVALVERHDGELLGLHRTFVTPRGQKAIRGERDRMALALDSLSGGAVRLAPAAEEMAVGEGIETSLSYMQLFGIPTWATLSTSGLRSVVLPPLPLARVVHIAMDLDANRAGEIAARAAAKRFEAEGRDVRFDRPAVDCKDFNDMVAPNAAA